MAPLELINLLFGYALLLALFAASALFLVQKQRWDERYSIHKRGWMPTWCWPCASLWLTAPLGIAGAIALHPVLLAAPVLVPPLFHLIRLDK